MKIFGEYLKISIISYLLVGCSSYYSISSYYGESDGIYYSTEKENYYETVFDEYAQYQNFDEQDEHNNIILSKKANIEFLNEKTIVILGMGTDGHTASLFPSNRNTEKAISQKSPDILVNSAPDDPKNRISFGCR